MICLACCDNTQMMQITKYDVVKNNYKILDQMETNWVNIGLDDGTWSLGVNEKMLHSWTFNGLIKKHD